MKEEGILNTKFGNAKINNSGYYWITSTKEGNCRKYLHRLVWEDHYGKPVPEGYDIHHINLDKLDNRIQNLQCVEHSLHMRFHSKGKKHSEQSKRKNSISNSKTKNTTGYYRVTKQKDKTCKQGFQWRYQYNDGNMKSKTISSVDIKKLEQKVLERGLPWYKIGDD